MIANIKPLTISSVAYATIPAELAPLQIYFPALYSWICSIESKLFRFPAFITVMPIASEIGAPLNSQDMYKGRSPSSIHCTLAYCPVEYTPSKEKGTIFGGT